MFHPSNHEINNKGFCTHCWATLDKDKAVNINGNCFCSLRCLKAYYYCILNLSLKNQAKRFKTFFLVKKGWATGLIAGLILSVVSLIVFGIILCSPISRPPVLPPITEATVDIPLMVFPLSLNGLNPDIIQKTDRSEEDKGVKEAREREIKERVKIDLIKEYPSGRQKTVGISGHALSDTICALYLNNSLYEATTCRKGRFFFPRICLSKGKNIIEVIAHDPEGYTVPSNTIELFVDLNFKVTEKGRNVTRGNIEESNFAITFDGGASASCAPEILDILRRYQLRCTFFLEGDFIRNHPDLVLKMIEDGHEIGNHTDTHPHLARLNPEMRFETLPWVNREFLQNQIKKVEEAFFRLTGRRMAPFWRAPYGEHNLEIRTWAEEIGYTHVSWTCGRVLEEGLDTLDWVYNEESDIYYSAEQIKDKIISFGEDSPDGANGGIVLMHLATSRPMEDRIHKQLPLIIEGLRQRGYRLATVSDMMGHVQGAVAKSVKSSEVVTKKGTGGRRNGISVLKEGEG